VPRHIARLVTRLVAPLVVDYSASPRLVVDYFVFAARPGASAHRAARHAACRAARRRLLVADYSASRRLVADYSASRRLVVDYFAYAARPGASARRAAHRRLLRAAQSRRRLLRAPRLRLAATLALLQPRCGVRLLVSRQHWLYFECAACCHDAIFLGRIASTIHLD
jgi:hypothetical protein